MYSRLRQIHVCLVLVAAAMAVWLMPSLWSGDRPAGVPYGVLFLPHSDNFGTQDFAYNLNFLDQIARKTVAHPYRYEDQEHMVQQWFPRMASGLPHAYSPVALVMGLPLLALPPSWAFDLVNAVNALLLIALTCFFLLPRVVNSVQVGVLIAAFFSFVLFDIFFMGQTAILTASVLAAGYALLSKRTAAPPLSWRNVLLALLVYILAAKPSVALILIAMLASEGAWMALGMAGLALGLTWIAVASHYGGLLTGLQDYAWLLDHYCLADATPFMKRGMSPGISTNFTSYLTVLYPAQSAINFLASRILFQALVLLLLIARWKKWISLTTQFHGLIWSFLLFCPYLLVTEDFAICLLAASPFFRPGASAPLKLLLVFLLGNSCMGIATALPFFFPIKLALAGWWLLDLVIGPTQREVFAATASRNLGERLS